MQAADFFAAIPVPGAQPQAGAGRPDAAGGAAGVLGALFAPAEGVEAAFGDTGFAEALMAVLGVVQPQQPIQTTPAPTGEGTDAIEGLADGFGGKSARSTPPALLLQPQGFLPAGVETGAPAEEIAIATPEAGAVQIAAAQTDLPEDADAALAPKAAPEGRAPVQTALADADLSLAQSVATALGLKAPRAETTVKAAPPAPVAAAAPAAPLAPPPSAPVSTVAAAPAPAAAPVTSETEVSAQVQAAATRPGGTDKTPRRSKSDASAAQAVGKASEQPAAVVQAAVAEKTLTENAVAAAAPAESDEALAADDTAALSQPHLPVHAEVKTAGHAAAFEEAKATPQTVALLSAQIAKSAENGRSTRFEMQLEPHGLGKVEVKVEINSRGEVRADLSFENPVAAAELRARSGELQSALERAGFDGSKTQLSFNSGGQHQGQFAQGWSDQQQQQQQNSSNWRGAAFMDLGDAPPNPAHAYASGERDGGVDVRI